MKFLVRGELDESIIRKILDPILLGIDRTTHNVAYRISIGVVEYVSMPLGSSRTGIELQVFLVPSGRFFYGIVMALRNWRRCCDQKVLR
jgi:hypothetical protein